MKLYDPKTELELFRLAKLGRNSKPMEVRDGHVWRTMLASLSYPLLLVALLLVILGASSPEHREPHWQFAICSVVLTVAAFAGPSIALKPINQPGCHAALVNLPVKGDFLFRKIRNRFLIRSVLWLGALSFIFAFAVSGFSFRPTWQTVASTMLLFGTTLSTVAILYEPPPILRYTRTLWTSIGLLLACGMLILYYNGSGYFKTGATPPWLASAVLSVTWLFPPTWALPGRMEQGGGVLALLWCLWGYAKWKAWPEVIGWYFDTPQDFFGSSSFVDLQNDDEEHPYSPEETDDSGETDPTCSPLAFTGDRWVERWVRLMIGKKDALIAGTLIDQNDTWTKRTHLAIICGLILLLLNWAVLQIPNHTDGDGTFVNCIWIASNVTVPLLLLQFSNGVPRAMAQWGAGPQSLPFLSLLPISARDMLRVSTRITLARSMILAAITTPYFWCLYSIRQTEISPADALWLVPSFCCFWTASRPLLVWYRLQSVGRCRSGMFLRDSGWISLVIAVAIAWLVTGAAGIFFGLISLESVNAVDRASFGLMAFGGILVSGLCARATFEIHHWRLRRGHFDWVSER